MIKQVVLGPKSNQTMTSPLASMVFGVAIKTKVLYTLCYWGSMSYDVLFQRVWTENQVRVYVSYSKSLRGFITFDGHF